MFFYFLFALLICLPSSALESFSSLENKLYDKNMDYQSQNEYVESKKLTLSSGYSNFYPTLNLSGGWQINKTDDLSNLEQGYIGYLEGRANIFHGFKDQAQLKIQSVDLQISQLDLEIKKQDLRLQLTEIVSDMIYLHQLQNVLREELKVTKTQRQMAAKKVAAGLTGAVDHLELDLRENEIEIEIKQIDQAHSENHQKLTQLYGYDVADAELDHISFSTIDTFSKFSQNLKFEENLNIKKTKWTKNKYQYEKESIQAEFLPSLDLTYSFGRLTPSDKKNIDLNESKYGLILTFPLFSGFDTYYKTKAAYQQLKSVEKAEKQFIISSLSEFNILKTKIFETLALYSINERKMQNAQKYFDLTLAEYRRGTKNSPDLVGATDRLFSTKKKTFELIKDLEILKTKLEMLGAQTSSE